MLFFEILIEEKTSRKKRLQSVRESALSLFVRFAP